jgi:uncharacterized membrane protein HdeD (DUF308 family)
VKSPGWVRALDVIFGLITIILLIVVLAYPELAILTLISVLSFVFLLNGIARIASGITGARKFELQEV